MAQEKKAQSAAAPAATQKAPQVDQKTLDEALNRVFWMDKETKPRVVYSEDSGPLGFPEIAYTDDSIMIPEGFVEKEEMAEYFEEKFGKILSPKELKALIENTFNALDSNHDGTIRAKISEVHEKTEKGEGGALYKTEVSYLSAWGLEARKALQENPLLAKFLAEFHTIKTRKDIPPELLVAPANSEDKNEKATIDPKILDKAFGVLYGADQDRKPEWLKKKQELTFNMEVPDLSPVLNGKRSVPTGMLEKEELEALLQSKLGPRISPKDLDIKALTGKIFQTLDLDKDGRIDATPGYKQIDKSGRIEFVPTDSEAKQALRAHPEIAEFLANLDAADVNGTASLTSPKTPAVNQPQTFVKKEENKR